MAYDYESTLFVACVCVHYGPHKLLQNYCFVPVGTRDVSNMHALIVMQLQRSKIL